jgi:redox-sensitive bicupin YhaK (pirin superfamily)
MSTTSGLRPDVSVRRGADRRQTRIGWLHGRHSFDTGVDPLGADTHHGVLIVNNHDTIAPGSGFETHPHRNMEIVTWVLNGSLVHQDSEGHTGVIYPNLAQRMTAGTGVRHSEKNDRSAVNLDAGRPLDLIQMWVVPDEPEVTPGYEQLELDPADLQGQLAVVASGMERHRDRAAIRIRNRYAALHVARLSPGQSVTVPDAPFAHVYVARGRMDLEAEGVLDVSGIELELARWAIDTESSVSRTSPCHPGRTGYWLMAEVSMRDVMRSAARPTRRSCSGDKTSMTSDRTWATWPGAAAARAWTP